MTIGICAQRYRNLRSGKCHGHCRAGQDKENLKSTMTYRELGIFIDCSNLELTSHYCFVIVQLLISYQ